MLGVAALGACFWCCVYICCCLGASEQKDTLKNLNPKEREEVKNGNPKNVEPKEIEPKPEEQKNTEPKKVEQQPEFK